MSFSPKGKNGPMGVLLTVKSYDCGTSPDGTCTVGTNAPSLASSCLTISVGVLFLTFMEHLLRFVFSKFMHVHPLFEIELNRMVLARHLGVDVLGCATVAYLGLKNRHVCQDLWDNVFLKGSNSMPEAAFDQRMFGYHPAAQQIATFFVTYQLKNTYDCFVWHDGPEFIFHHVLSLTTAWGSMYPGCGHVYVVFFMGISEFSTAILCLLANFDDDFGVVGLGDAFPLLKVGVGLVFVVCFIVVRSTIWPYFGYHFARDALNALKSEHPMVPARRKWLWWFTISLSGLSVLQVLWLGQIFVMAKEEIAKVL